MIPQHYKRWPLWAMKLALSGYIKSFHWLYNLMVFVGVRVATLEAHIHYRQQATNPDIERTLNDLIPPSRRQPKSDLQESRERRSFLEECFNSPDGSPPTR